MAIHPSCNPNLPPDPMTHMRAKGLVLEIASEDYNSNKPGHVPNAGEARAAIQAWYRNAAELGRGDLARAIDKLTFVRAAEIYAEEISLLDSGDYENA